MTVCLLLLLAVAASPVHRAAVIVGVNEPFDASQAPLHYADDDASRYFELLRPHADVVEILSVLDAETQSIHPETARAALVPDERTLARVLESVALAAARAREDGRRTELYFVYIGHGRVRGGEGEVKLAGGALSRTRFTDLVLARDDHDRAHVVIDACNAYHLVNARGAGGVTLDFDDAFARFVSDQDITRFPRIGVVLSTSGLGETHEWSRYRGGVFSHEVRSALSGAADADGDGHIGYAELEAFVAAANLGVPELKGRPKVFVRPPAIERGAIVLHALPSLAQIALPELLEGHFYVEDDRGVRYAEWNKAAGHSLFVSLVPRPSYELLTAAGESVARFEPVSGRMQLSLPLVRGGATRLARGDHGPPGIFQEPYGPRFFDGFRASRAPVLSSFEPEPGWSTAHWVGTALGGTALAAGSVAIWQGQEAAASYDRYLGAFDRDKRDAFAESVLAARNRSLGFGIGAAIAAAAAGISFFLFD